MKKVVCKVEYDTEKSELIGKRVSGEFGDPAGYEESLYKTADGKYFLYVNGGAESIYPEENIKRLSVAKAEEFIKVNL
ncbi:MAG: hypothetical protein ACI4GB_03015 [Acutalibacteraceae bacterium]